MTIIDAPSTSAIQCGGGYVNTTSTSTTEPSTSTIQNTKGGGTPANDDLNFYICSEVTKRAKKFGMMKRDIILRLKTPDSDLVSYLENSVYQIFEYIKKILLKTQKWVLFLIQPSLFTELVYYRIDFYVI